MTLGANSSIDSEDAVLMMRRVEFKQNAAAVADPNNLLLQNEKVKMSLEIPGTQTFTSSGG